MPEVLGVAPVSIPTSAGKESVGTAALALGYLRHVQRTTWLLTGAMRCCKASQRQVPDAAVGHVGEVGVRVGSDEVGEVLSMHAIR